MVCGFHHGRRGRKCVQGSGREKQTGYTDKRGRQQGCGDVPGTQKKRWTGIRVGWSRMSQMVQGCGVSGKEGEGRIEEQPGTWSLVGREMQG